MSKGPDAPALKLANTMHKVEERVTQNDQRELALLREGVQLNPLEMLGLRLETFIETSLGERRYIDYVNKYQEKREGVLEHAEGVVARSKLQLPGTDGGTLLVPG